MAETPKTTEILENVQRDDCVRALEGQFFSDLADKGTPATAQDASKSSKDVVVAKEDIYLCQGTDVPPTQFGRLAKLATLKGFVRTLDEDERNRLLNDLGLTFGTLDAAPIDQVERLLSVYNDLLSPYRASIHMRGEMDFTFVTDHAIFPPTTPSWRAFVDQLGLRHYEAVPYGVVVHYPRSELAGKSLRVPRAFDGIDFPPFRVVVDCDATHGQTQPLAVGPPRPEAVHRGCHIARNQLIVQLCR